MPFASKPFIDEEAQKKKALSTGAGSSTSGGSVPGAGASAGPKSSGSYANIQDYLKANEGTATSMGAGERMAGDISASVSGEAEKAKTGIAGIGAAAPKVDAYDPNQAIKKIIEPSPAGITTQDKEQYKSMKATGGYTGPEKVDRVSGYKDAMNQTANAAAKVGLTGTETGQQTLLQDQYARPTYAAGSGQNKLDQALLQGSKQGKAQMQGLGNKYANLEGLFTEASTKTGNAINAATGQAGKNKKAVIDAETKAWQDFLNPIQARADQMNIDNPKHIANLQDDVKDERLMYDTLKTLGLKEGQNIYDLNLGSYVTPNLTKAGLNQAANAKERGKYQALADLFGDQTRTEIAGDYKNDPLVSFDRKGFDSAVALKDAERNKQLNETKGLAAVANSPIMNQTVNGQKMPSKKTFNDIGGDISQMSIKQVQESWLPKMKDYVSKMKAESDKLWRSQNPGHPKNKEIPKGQGIYDLSGAQSAIDAIQAQVDKVVNDPVAKKKVSAIRQSNVKEPLRNQTMPENMFKRGY